MHRPRRAVPSSCRSPKMSVLSVVRLEKEIQDLERAELRVSAHEEAILKKLKSVERTTEDIIRVSAVIEPETQISPPSESEGAPCFAADPHAEATLSAVLTLKSSLFPFQSVKVEKEGTPGGMFLSILVCVSRRRPLTNPPT